VSSHRVASLRFSRRYFVDVKSSASLPFPLAARRRAMNLFFVAFLCLRFKRSGLEKMHQHRKYTQTTFSSPCGEKRNEFTLFSCARVSEPIPTPVDHPQFANVNTVHGSIHTGSSLKSQISSNDKENTQCLLLPPHVRAVGR
jgi:hypothetical protein